MFAVQVRTGVAGIKGESFYFLRRCPPFSGITNTWPAKRLGFSGLAFDNGAVAVSENGLPSILTPNGVRQDVVVP